MKGPVTVPHERHQFVVLVTLCVGMFMAILDVNVIKIATISIRSEFHAPVSAITWAVDAYNLSLCGLMLSGGTLADRYGSRRIWLSGLVLFTCASLGCGISVAMWQLISFRILQGAGAALFIPASFSLLSAGWPDRHARQQAIGMFGGLVSVAAAAGPVLGGVLVGDFGWRSIFFNQSACWPVRYLFRLQAAARCFAIPFTGTGFHRPGAGDGHAGLSELGADTATGTTMGPECAAVSDAGITAVCGRFCHGGA